MSLRKGNIMLTTTAAFAICLLVLLRWPGLPIAGWLAAALVVPVARVLNGLTLGHWLLALMLSAGVGVVAWMGGDMIIVSALASPEILAFLAVVDTATLIEATLAAVAVAGATRGLSLRHWIGRRFGVRRPRGSRTRRVQRKAANDDDPAGGLPFRSIFRATNVIPAKAGISGGWRGTRAA